MSANNKEQDNKLIDNKPKTEDCLSDGFDNEDFTKKGNPFNLTFNDNVDKNNRICNNFIFNDNEYKNTRIGNNNNSYNELLLNLNFDKTFKDFYK